MAESTIWWLIAGIAVALELITGTFYLLMLAIGMAAAAIAAHLGAGTSAQLLVAAVVGGSTVGAWHFIRSRRPRDAPAESNHDVNLDIGGIVQIDAWNADGTASVNYRGANWTAIGTGGVGSTGQHRIRAINGSRLVVEKV